MAQSAHDGEHGFTIIEVLMVLAVAGLIALLIFQAIPTLTRNQRNSQRKQSVSSVLQALSRYQLSNGGGMPTSCSGACGFMANEKNLFYGQADVSVCTGAYSGGLSYSPCSAVVDQVHTTDITKVFIYNYQRCKTDGSGDGTSANAGYYDIVALYATERGGGGATSLCAEL